MSAAVSSSTTPEIDPNGDRTIKAVTVSIGVCAAMLAAASYFVVGGRFGLGVVAGGTVGLLNFVVLARVGKAITGKTKDAVFWGVVYLVKVIALFGGTFLMLRSGVVSGLGIVVGLTALVPGIVVGGLLAAPRDPNDGTGTQS